MSAPASVPRVARPSEATAFARCVRLDLGAVHILYLQVYDLLVHEHLHDLREEIVHHRVQDPDRVVLCDKVAETWRKRRLSF